MTTRERVRSRSRIRSRLAVVILIGFLATVSFLGAIIIPLYSHPGIDWNAIIVSKQANPGVAMVAIINPDSGPGQSQDPNYVKGVNDLLSAGVVVLGYDHTSYAARSFSDVIADINSYKSWYNVSGIFFDEMSSVPGNESYYSTLNQYAKSVGLNFTVGNPGASVPASYLGTMDVIVTYENQGVPNSSSLASITSGMPANNFAVIAYGVDAWNGSSVGSIFNYASYVYVTNNTVPNPYGAVTGDFSKLVALLGSLTHAQTSVSLGVKSVNAAGTPIVGLWTVIKSANGSVVASGYTPLTQSVRSGAGYVVSISTYGGFVFDHWSDGSTNQVKAVTVTGDTTLTADYGTSSPSITSTTASTSQASSSTILSSTISSTSTSSTTSQISRVSTSQSSSAKGPTSTSSSTASSAKSPSEADSRPGAPWYYYVTVAGVAAAVALGALLALRRREST